MYEKELNHQGILLVFSNRMKKLFIILTGKKQQLGLEIKRADGSTNLLSNSMSFRKYIDVGVTSSSPVYCLQQVAEIDAWEEHKAGQASATFLKILFELPLIRDSWKY